MKKQSEPYISIEENPSLEQVYVLLTFPLFDLYKQHEKEIELLAHILTSGSSSRLFTALREKHGITYGSSSYPFVYTDASVFIIRTTIHPNELNLGLKILLRELKKIKKHRIDHQELKKVKNITNNEILFSLTRPIDYLIYFGLNFLENREFKPDIDGEMAKIRHVKAETIQNLANTIFKKSKMNMFLYGNIKRGTEFDFIQL